MCVCCLMLHFHQEELSGEPVVSCEHTAMLLEAVFLLICLPCSPLSQYVAILALSYKHQTPCFHSHTRMHTHTYTHTCTARSSSRISKTLEVRCFQAFWSEKKNKKRLNTEFSMHWSHVLGRTCELNYGNFCFLSFKSF